MPADPRLLGEWAPGLVDTGALDDRLVVKNRQGQVRTFDLQGHKTPVVTPSIDGRSRVLQLDDKAKKQAGFAKGLDVYMVTK